MNLYVIPYNNKLKGFYRKFDDVAYTGVTIKSLKKNIKKMKNYLSSKQKIYIKRIFKLLFECCIRSPKIKRDI